MTNIFIETGAKNNEYIFIESLISYFCQKKNDIDYRIIGVGGKDNLKEFRNLFSDHESATERNTIIFDADVSSSSKKESGGFQNRFSDLRETVDLFKAINPTEIFLFPNNHDDGVFEDLLERIVRDEHRCILDYFKEYEEKLASCTDEYGNCKYNCPDKKAEIYAYASAVKKRSNKEFEAFKRGDWSFCDDRYWDLSCEYMRPLKVFLENLFS